MQQPRSVALLQNNANSRSSTSLITPRVTALSDPPPKLVDAHLLDFLTAEVIRIIITSSEVARTRQEEQEKLVTADFALLSGLSVSESTTAKQQSQVQKS
ncbi:bet3 family protein, partial [Pseudohyphozyma bogoriensis]